MPNNTQSVTFVKMTNQKFNSWMGSRSPLTGREVEVVKDLLCYFVNPFKRLIDFRGQPWIVLDEKYVVSYTLQIIQPGWFYGILLFFDAFLTASLCSQFKGRDEISGNFSDILWDLFFRFETEGWESLEQIHSSSEKLEEF